MVNNNLSTANKILISKIYIFKSFYKTKEKKRKRKMDINKSIGNIENTIDKLSDFDYTEIVNQVSHVWIRGFKMFSLAVDGEERVCLSQISNNLLNQFSYNEIHNRRVALGINCIQCSPSQLELLRRHGAMASSSRRCGMITRKDAERLVKSFLDESKPLVLPENFSFNVEHRCEYGCQGSVENLVESI